MTAQLPTSTDVLVVGAGPAGSAAAAWLARAGLDVVLADAVLLHLNRTEFALALRKARTAVPAGGLLAMTLKEGDGDEWHTRTLDRPRFFTYWREAELRAELEHAGWAVEWLEHVAGELEPWLYVIARAG